MEIKTLMTTRINNLFDDILSIDNTVMDFKADMLSQVMTIQNQEFLAFLETIRSFKHEEYQRLIKWLTLLDNQNK